MRQKVRDEKCATRLLRECDGIYKDGWRHRGSDQRNRRDGREKRSPAHGRDMQ